MSGDLYMDAHLLGKSRAPVLGFPYDKHSKRVRKNGKPHICRYHTVTGPKWVVVKASEIYRMALIPTALRSRMVELDADAKRFTAHLNRKGQ